MAGISNNKLETLEALRGAAAVYVLCHHTIPRDTEFQGLPIGMLLSFGQEAVILFFLLSGFVITYAFNRTQQQSFGDYFSRRFCRIYIPLVLVFLVTWITESHRTGQLVNPEIGNLVGNLLMLQDFGSELPGSVVLPYLGNGPLWSLSYEWWFYMMFFPLVTLVSDQRQRHVIAFGIASVAAVGYLAYPVFGLRVLMHFAIWWTGVYLATLYLAGKHYQIRALLPPLLVLAFITSLTFAKVALYYLEHGQIPGLLPHPVNEFRHFAFTLFIVPAGLLWLRFGAPLYRVLIRPFAWFAPVSYGIYISHDPLMVDATYLSFIGNPVVEWFGYCALVLSFSALIELVAYPRLRKLIGPRIAALAGSRRVQPDTRKSGHMAVSAKA